MVIWFSRSISSTCDNSKAIIDFWKNKKLAFQENDELLIKEITCHKWWKFWRYNAE